MNAFTPIDLNGNYLISYEGKIFTGGQYGSNLNVAAAHLLGLSYKDYLLYLRDTFNGEIRGRIGIPVVYFKEREKARLACLELNRRHSILEDFLKDKEISHREEKVEIYNNVYVLKKGD